MRWTLLVRKTKRASADGEVVWSWPPDAEVKSADDLPPMTVAIKPGTPGRVRRKP